MMIPPLNTGQIVSGAGHIGVIGWALFGGVFSSEPLPFEVTEVMAISSEEYAALVARQDSPDAASDIVTPDAPEIEDATPDMAATPDDPPEVTQPDVAEATEPDAVPDVPQPAPDTEVADEPPVLETPSEDMAVLLPEPDIRPQPRPAPRVAPEPVAQPDPDVAIDDVVQEETTPSEDAGTVQEDTEATSPEEATTEIVTEADEVAQAAPSRSVRPQTRPQRAAQPEPSEDTTPSNDAVNDALAEALGTDGTDTNPEPTGPPLTSGEKDALRVAVEQCWNVGSLSSEALNTTVVVGVKMSEDGKPQTNSIQMLSSSGGSGAAAQQAYEAARRAIIRCGARGYDLPVEKYDRWRDIEMTFNPEKMRIK
ncbi:energy transducer TonB [Roseovarius sp. 2305UL8-3]|uniref:energy transducer TonB n=1 Tax=Roseovarius conchicola TaxID=3121636 RepID=UPI00352970F1